MSPVKFSVFVCSRTNLIDTDFRVYVGVTLCGMKMFLFVGGGGGRKKYVIEVEKRGVGGSYWV